MPWLVPNPSSPSASMQALIKTSHARRSTRTAGSFLPLLENRVAHVGFMMSQKKKVWGHFVLSWHIMKHVEVSECDSAVLSRTVTYMNPQAPSRSRLDVSARSDTATLFETERQIFPPMIPWYCLTSLKIPWPDEGNKKKKILLAPIEFCVSDCSLSSCCLPPCTKDSPPSLFFWGSHICWLVGLFISWWQVRPHVLCWLMTCCVAVQVIKHTIMA